MIPTLNMTHSICFPPPPFRKSGLLLLIVMGAYVGTGYTVGCTIALPRMHPLFHPESELDLNHWLAPSTIPSCLYIQSGWDSITGAYILSFEIVLKAGKTRQGVIPGSSLSIKSIYSGRQVPPR